MRPHRPSIAGSAVCFAAVLFVLLAFNSNVLAKNIPKSPPLPEVWLYVGETKLLAEVPLTWEERRLGLGGRDGLAEGRAMAFIFVPPAAALMSMRDMRFGLDFIWCAGGRVAGITADVPYGDSAPASITPPGEVDMVIEVPAGWAERHGIKPGVPVSISIRSGSVRRSALERLILSMPR